LGLALGTAACEGCRTSPAPDARSSAAVASVAEGPPALRLYLVSDLAGALEPCGCTKDQLGGLDHFGAWVKQSRPQAAASFVAAAGPLFFMDPRLDRERADQDREKADTVARVLKGLDFVAFAPGENDWAAGPETLAALAARSGAVALVPGGAIATDAGAGLFATSVVRTTAGGLHVGFVGGGQPSAGPAAARVGVGAAQSAEAVVTAAADAAKAQGADVLVALVATGRGEAKRIADAVPDLAAIVVGSARAEGDRNTEAPPIERVGDTLVIQAANHLQDVAVLDLYVREPRPAGGHGPLLKFADATGVETAARRQALARRIDDLHVKIAAWERDGTIAPADLAARRRDLAELEGERDSLDAPKSAPRGNYFRYSLKEMRESLGKDPAVEADMLAYYKAVDERNKVEFANRAPPPLAAGEAGYVGVETCSVCHSEAVDFWKTTAHSHAYATLATQFKEFNLDCVSCHVTGYEKPGGSTVTHVDKLESVQCEVCHGPGSKHARFPLDKRWIVAKPSGSSCLGCHHPPHVEGFDPEAKRQAILGPGHGGK
jgi:Cytochrome c554 and c-prime